MTDGQIARLLERGEYLLSGCIGHAHAIHAWPPTCDVIAVYPRLARLDALSPPWWGCVLDVLAGGTPTVPGLGREHAAHYLIAVADQVGAEDAARAYAAHWLHARSTLA